MFKSTSFLGIFFLSAFTQLLAQSNTWEQLPGPFGGSITCAAQQDTVWYIGTGSGVFRSSDEGENWEILPWISQSQTVTSILFQPGEIVVATTGAVLPENSIDHWLALIYRSTDNGQSWSVDTIRDEFASPYNLKVFRQRGTLFASDVEFVGGGNGYLKRSDDNGHSWENLVDNFFFLFFDFNDSLLLGDEGIGQPQYSRDGGDNWELLSPPVGSIFGTYSLGKGNTIFYFGDSETSYRTTNFGATWQAINMPTGFYLISKCKVLPNGKLAAMFEYPNEEALIFTSDNNGQSWQKYNGTPVALAVDVVANGTVYGVATPQGFYKNYGAGNFLNVSNTGITASDVSSLLIHEGQFLAGSVEGLWRSFDGGSNWVASFPQSFLAQTREIQAKGDTLCALTNSNFFYSTDNGDSWINPYVSGGWGTDGPFDQAKYFAIDGERLLVGAYDQYLSDDFGANWAFNTMSWNGSGVVTAGGRYFAINYSNGIMRSINQGNSWQVVHPGITGKGRMYYLHGKVFAAMEYFGLRSSSDLGNTWSQASGFPKHGMFNYVYPVRALAANDTVIFAALDYAGIYQSKDEGASWTLFSDNLPNLRFNDLLLDNGILYAACSGGGIWEYDITSVGTHSPLAAQPLSIWPNPVGSQGAHLNCPSDFETPMYITVYNALGQRVFSQSAQCEADNLQLPLENLTPGVYRLMATMHDEVRIGSFIKN